MQGLMFLYLGCAPRSTDLVMVTPSPEVTVHVQLKLGYLEVKGTCVAAVTGLLCEAVTTMLPLSLTPLLLLFLEGSLADSFLSPVSFLDRMSTVNLPSIAVLPVGILAGKRVHRNHLDKVVWVSITGFLVCNAGSLTDGLQVAAY